MRRSQHHKGLRLPPPGPRLEIGTEIETDTDLLHEKYRAVLGAVQHGDRTALVTSLGVALHEANTTTTFPATIAIHLVTNFSGTIAIHLVNRQAHENLHGLAIFHGHRTNSLADQEPGTHLEHETHPGHALHRGKIHVRVLLH